jgi:ubiquinone/menaquinone biosynthesis C-methylase UbiE
MVNQLLVKNFMKLKSDWDIAAKTKYFRDYIAQGFNEEESFRKSGENNTKWIREFLNSNGVDWASKRVVEVGCGAGRMTEFIAKDAGHVQAVDISAEMLNRMKERLTDMHNIEPLCIIRDFSVISDMSVDLIISFLVFQHTPEDMVDRLIQDGRRILKPSGYYFFQLPLAGTHKCVPVNDANALDMVYWDKQEVIDMVSKHRFDVISQPQEHSDSQFFLLKKESER